MATTTLNTTDQNEQPFKRALRAIRARIDAFVSSRTQNAVPEAARAKAFGCSQSERRAAQTGQAEARCMQPLSEDILSTAIPAFFIGRNKEGLSVARESRGRIGGKFLFRRSALAFARAQTEPVHRAMIFPSERFELDVQNGGNLLAPRALLLLHSGAPSGRQIAKLVRAAGLALASLAGIVALQAAVYVYVWRLLG